jgi:hypothetical protein
MAKIKMVSISKCNLGEIRIFTSQDELSDSIIFICIIGNILNSFFLLRFHPNNIFMQFVPIEKVILLNGSEMLCVLIAPNIMFIIDWQGKLITNLRDT